MNNNKGNNITKNNVTQIEKDNKVSEKNFLQEITGNDFFECRKYYECREEYLKTVKHQADR